MSSSNSTDDHYLRIKKELTTVLKQILEEIKGNYESKIITQCLNCIIYPEKYINNEGKSYRIFEFGLHGPNGEGGVLPIMVPGVDKEWDSLYHLNYIFLNIVYETKLYKYE